MCGEQKINEQRSKLKQGSSPRVRGAVLNLTLDDEGLGIIPACAGSSRLLVSCMSHTWGHPRVCGEQAFSFLA